MDSQRIKLAALARVPTATTITSNQAQAHPEDYAKSVRRLAEAFRVFAEKHDETTVRNTVPKLPELLSVHLRRVNSPRFLPNEVSFLNRDLLMRSGAYTELLIEQGKINEVAELAEKLLGQGDLGFARWMVRELANAAQFETLRLEINDAIEKSGAKKHVAPLPPWENRRFLALSAYTAYSAGKRDLCFDIFMKLDRNWMSPSYVSRVAGDAQRAGDIAFLCRMESSTSPLMREAALRALAMHHVLSGEIDEASVAADAFDKEFGRGDQNWLIYRWIAHKQNVKDPNRRIFRNRTRVAEDSDGFQGLRDRGA